MASNAARDLADKVVVITGASSGIGRGAAQAFAAAGARVVLAARRGDLLAALAAELAERGGEALAVPCDVSEPAQVQQLAQAAVQRYGHVDVWINNAGVGVVGRFDEVPLREHEQVLRTNLLGSLYGCYQALRLFRARGRGILINVSSLFGKLPGPYWASYVASKFALNGLGDALRQELRQIGLRDVHVCTVLPMTTDTPFFLHAGNHTGREIGLPRPIHAPRKVVETLLQVVRHPEDEVIVGNAGRLVNAMHALAPATVERVFAMQTHRLQYRKAAPGARTAGAVLRPMPGGGAVEGGHRRRPPG